MSHAHKFKRYDLPSGGYTEQCVVCGEYLPTVVDALAAELARMKRQWEGAVASYDTVSAQATRYSEALTAIKAKAMVSAGHDVITGGIVLMTEKALGSAPETKAQQCEWVLDDGQYIGSCDPNKFINISPVGMTYCPYCGRPVITAKTKGDQA